MALRVCKIGPVVRLKTAVVLVLQYFVLDAHAVLARDAGDVLVTFQIVLQVRLEEFLRLHVSHVLLSAHAASRRLWREQISYCACSILRRATKRPMLWAHADFLLGVVQVDLRPV